MSALTRFAVGIDPLTTLMDQILLQHEIAEDDRRLILDSLLEADLRQQSGHGVQRFPFYLNEYRQGRITAAHGPASITGNGLVRTVSSDHFGQVAAKVAIDAASCSARENGIAVQFWRDLNHIGCVGYWTRAIAKKGLAAMMLLNTSGTPRVAPYGGREPRLGTDVMSVAVPNVDCPNRPLGADFSFASMVEGKVRTYYQNGTPLPESFVISADGRATTDASSIYQSDPAQRGSILPLGGEAHQKGFAGIFAIDLLVTVLGGGGYANGRGADGKALTINRNNVLLLVVDPASVNGHDGYIRRFFDYSNWVQSAKPTQEGSRVELPGEHGAELMRQALERGQIELDAATINALNQLARDHSLAELRMMS